MERIISTNQELERDYPYHGVCVLIWDENGRILMGLQNSFKEESKKEPGQWGLVSETAELHESWKNTLIRGIEEELGLDQIRASELLYFDPEYSYVAETAFTDKVGARVLFLYCPEPEEIVEQFERNDEFDDIEWVSLEGISNRNVREGVTRVMQHLQTGGLIENRNRIYERWLYPLTLEGLSRIG